MLTSDYLPQTAETTSCYIKILKLLADLRAGSSNLFNVGIDIPLNLKDVTGEIVRNRFNEEFKEIYQVVEFEVRIHWGTDFAGDKVHVTAKTMTFRIQKIQ